MKKIAGFSARARGSVSINGGYERMVREIVRDVFFLGQKSEPATKQDISVGQDLMDTLKANQESNSQLPSFCKDFVNESFNINPKI